VVKALYRGDTVAAKEIRLDATPEAQGAFVTEAVRLQGLRHPHVVRASPLRCAAAGWLSRRGMAGWPGRGLES
jgi:hypothetical protein